MYTIKDFPPQISPDLIQRLKQVETATVGHFYYSGFMDWRLRAVIPDRRVAGTAVTVRAPAIDGTMVGYAVSKARPGDFLVIDRCGDLRHACWGGVTVRAARNARIAGTVIDGLATDFAEIRDLDMPLWCLGPSSLTVKRIPVGGAVNVAVSCGGVVVKPGDAILADEMGVLVLDPAEVETVTKRALRMQEEEKTIIARLDAGETYADVTGLFGYLDEVTG